MVLRSNRSLNPLLTKLEKQPRLAWILSALWLLFISWLAFGWNLGQIGLLDETEPLFAEAARQMVEDGDWITPYFNGDQRFDKPPLIYWLMAIAYQVIGVNEWAVRLPSALSAVALILFSFITLRYFGFPGFHSSSSPPAQRWLSAWMGATLMALNPQMMAWGRVGVSDMLLTSCIGVALLSFFWGYTQPLHTRAKSRWYLAFYVFCGLAVLTKGPVGVVLPGFIVTTFLLYLGQFRSVLRELNLVRGTLIFLLIAIPWYVLVFQANGQDFIDSFFGYHNFERFTRVVNNHAAPWYFYVPVILIGFAPWAVYLPVAIARLRFWQQHSWQQQPRSQHLGLFALIWFAVILAFFTIAVTKLPSYMLPLMPAAAILAGLWWSEEMTRERPSRRAWISHLFNSIFLIALAILIPYSYHWMGGNPTTPDLPEIFRQSQILQWGGLCWGIAAIASGFLLWWGQGRWIWVTNLIGLSLFILLTVMPGSLLLDAQRQLPIRQIADTIRQVRHPWEEVLLVDHYKKPSLVFYSQRRVRFLSASEVIPRIRHRAQVEQTPRTALLVAPPRKLEEIKLNPNQYEVLDQKGVYKLLRVDLTRRRKYLTTP